LPGYNTPEADKFHGKSAILFVADCAYSAKLASSEIL
jgi:hypothetical protein